MRVKKTASKPAKKPKPEWELTILGCGTSTGVPLMFCDCKVCRSKDPRNHRLRTSAWLKTGAKSLLIDASTDLRQQAMSARIPRLDAILFTHPHADHVSGIDEVRSFNYIQKQRIPAFGNAWTCRELRVRYPYIFEPTDKVEGGGIPLIDLHEFDSHAASLDVAGVPVTPIALSHGSAECIGYRVGSFGYVTDCNAIPESSLERLRGLDTLVLDCLRIAPHGTHLNLERALEVIRNLRPKRTVLTHLGHDFDYREWSKKLPRGVALAYDGLKLRG
ncbi:MAG: MBL fold metallo-hydrolase [Bdellovibrionales bacterium]|nr:MBL fold metallo-hydrolase [Bdellovibrionales bacterium]